jgi:iron(III) transport system substrate-binding protein
MKKTLALCLVALMCCTVLFGCQSASPAPASSPDSAAPNSAAPAPASSSSDAPAAEAISEDDKWNDMTDEELYELAKQEGGEIVIYAITSRMPRTCEAFMEAYPELKAVSTDFDQNEAVSKIEIEARSNNVAADILQCKDSAGEIFYDFFPAGYLETFYPTDICSKIDPELMKYGMPFYVGLNFWYYNTELHQTSPVDNWWQIIEKDENGNNKYNLILENLTSNDTTMALYCHMILMADEMAQSYEQAYGKPLEYTYDASQTPGVPENNAGYEFLYRLSQCKLTFIGDGDDVVEAVHAGGANGMDSLGFCSAGKITNRDENNWNIAWVEHLEPFVSVMNANYLYIVKGCDNPAGARLFIRFLMGGTDGDGPGFKPFTKEGNWSIRSDYTNPNNPFAANEINTIPSDIEGIYNIFLDAKDFWDYWLAKSPVK